MHTSLLLRTTLGTLALLGTTLLPAQESKVRSKVKADLSGKPDEGIGIAKMVRGDGGSIVVLKTKGGRTVLGGVPQPQLDWSLHAINSESMLPIKSDKPKIVWGEGPVALETIETFGRQFRLIATKPDPENNTLLVLQQVLSPRSLTGKAAQKLVEIPYDRLGKGPEYFVADMPVGFTTTISTDSTKLLLGLTPASTTRSAGCPVFAQVFDKQMKPLWSNTLATDANAKRIDIVGTKVDPAGAVWYLIRNVSNPDPKLREELGYSFSLYRLDSAGQQAALLDFGKKEFAQEAAFDILADGTIVCAGVYSTPEANRNESVGVFRTTLDVKEMKWAAPTKVPYEKQLVKKEERLQNNMHLDHIWPKKDGSLYVVTQKAGIESHMVSDLSGKKVERTEWVGGPFHIMELTPAGEAKWYKRVDRDMGHDNGGPGRIISLSYDDVLFLLFNDEEGNFEKRKSKLPVDQVTNAKDAVMLEFKPDGADKGKVVLKEGYKQGYFDASSVWYMGNGLVGTIGSPGFGKDKTFPVLVEMSKDTKK